MNKYRLLLLGIAVALVSCGDNLKTAKKVSEEPIEQLIRKFKWNDFSVVLDDMKIGENPEYLLYQHKYKVLSMEKDSLHVYKQPWRVVNKEFFKKHENDLGMEIYSKHDGKVSRIAKPVGFGWAIGNEKHGEWVTQKDSTKTASGSHSSNRVWRSHSMSPFFWYWLGSRNRGPVYSNGFNAYQRNASEGKSYYGPNASSGTYAYGTRSSYERKNRSNFFTRKMQDMNRWNGSVRRKSRTSSSSSRFSNGSSTRSRSGGFGK